MMGLMRVRTALLFLLASALLLAGLYIQHHSMRRQNMKLRLATMAAVLVLTASLATGAFGADGGTVAAQGRVHEADGTWHRVTDKGDPRVSFNVTHQGHININWSPRFGVVYVEGGEGQPGSDIVPAKYHLMITHMKGGVPRTVGRDTTKYQTRIRNVDFGIDYSIMLQARNADNEAQGETVNFAVKPRHVSAPAAPRNLTATSSDDGQSVTVKWDAPTTGGKPKHYRAFIVNTDTGRVISDKVFPRVKKGRPAAQTTFAGLWPGDSYRAAVYTYVRNTRYDPATDKVNDRWLISESAVANAMTTDVDDPSYAKKEPTLVLEPVAAGEAAPPWMIGTPTAYVISVGGEYQRFDAPTKCLNYQDPHRFIMNGDLEAWKAVSAARSQWYYYLEPARAALRQAKDDGASAEEIAQKQREVDAAQRILDARVSTMTTECARAYPEVVNLTNDDRRWYQMARRSDWENVD